MALDTRGDVYVYSRDGVSQLEIPPSLVALLRAGSNSYGSDILIRETDNPAGAATDPRIIRDATFLAYKIPGDQLVPGFHFPQPDATLACSGTTEANSSNSMGTSIPCSKRFP